MDRDFVYILSSLGVIYICCFCSLLLTRCLCISNNKNITKDIEPTRIEIIQQPNYQITNTQTASMAGYN
jgi:hypothetical protein